MRKRAKRSNKSEIINLNNALLMNGRAMDEGPKRKHWTSHDLKTIKPLTATQEDMFHAWYNGSNLCAHGCAGTGKTFLALYLALTAVTDHIQNRIIIVRSAVATRDIGFLPGSLEEKIATYELPYHDIMWELVGRPNTYDDMKQAGLVEFMTTSFVRGLTWDNAVVVVDECQNMTFHEIDSIMTRLGQNTRIIVTGDVRQSDLEGKRNGSGSGMDHFMTIARNMKEFTSIKFTTDDIVRSDLVKAWIIAAEQTKYKPI